MMSKRCAEEAVLVRPQKIPIIDFSLAKVAQQKSCTYGPKKIILEILGNGLLHDYLLNSPVLKKKELS
jgi:hypothetical protein